MLEFIQTKPTTLLVVVKAVTRGCKSSSFSGMGCHASCRRKAPSLSAAMI